MEMRQVSVLLVFITFCNIHDAYHFSPFKCNYSEKDLQQLPEKKNLKPPTCYNCKFSLLNFPND